MDGDEWREYVPCEERKRLLGVKAAPEAEAGGALGDDGETGETGDCG
jgi:hypothetical protein